MKASDRKISAPSSLVVGHKGLPDTVMKVCRQVAVVAVVLLFTLNTLVLSFR